MGFCGRFLGTKGTLILANSMMFISFILSCFCFYETSLSSSLVHIKLGTWLDSETLYLEWGFLFDSITTTMLVVVTFVSLLVHIFSISYMNNDPHIIRFFFFLTLFTLFMVILITADNFVQMFFGWEGVGLASYLLINFWYTRFQANKSAIKAICLNRIGDFALIIALAAIFYKFNSFDYLVVFPLIDFYLEDTIQFSFFKFHYLSFIMFFIFIGAVAKSAQLGLHVWLPDAMEGPTPVSALIHAATMVTAGVFVLIRCAPLLECTPYIKNIITVVGSLTAFFAASVGLVQNDIKRIIAFSTCSQLGYMVFACGVSAYSIGFFHMINHAFFKALLFLSAGAVIHSINDEQDIRRMGGLLKPLNFVYVMFVIGSLALTGFPFLTGFYSKDQILEYAYTSYTNLSFFGYWLGLVTATFTAFYSMRLLIFVFFFPSSSPRKTMEGIHDLSIFVYIPLFLLALGSLFFGYLFKDLVTGYGSSFWDGLFTTYGYTINTSYEYIKWPIKILPLIFSLMGMFISIILFYFIPGFFIKIPLIHTFLSKKWGFDNLYQHYITLPILRSGYSIFLKILDRGFFELIGPLGIVRCCYHISSFFKKIQTGLMFHYLFVFLLSFFLFIVFSILLYFYIDLFILFILLILYFKIIKKHDGSTT